jgi:hypothetical protein
VELEFVYHAAGGKSTKVSRPTVEAGYRWRASPFIDFVWQVLLQMPEQMRPDGTQALAVTWENIQKQK